MSLDKDAANLELVSAGGGCAKRAFVLKLAPGCANFLIAESSSSARVARNAWIPLGIIRQHTCSNTYAEDGVPWVPGFHNGVFHHAVRITSAAIVPSPGTSGFCIYGAVPYPSSHSGSPWPTASRRQLGQRWSGAWPSAGYRFSPRRPQRKSGIISSMPTCNR